MKQHVKIEEKNPFGNALEEVLREGARKMLQQAIENEVTEFIREHQQITDEKGHQLVTRNGYQPRRLIQTGIGPIEVRKPRLFSGALAAYPNDQPHRINLCNHPA